MPDPAGPTIAEIRAPVVSAAYTAASWSSPSGTRATLAASSDAGISGASASASADRIRCSAATVDRAAYSTSACAVNTLCPSDSRRRVGPTAQHVGRGDLHRVGQQPANEPLDAGLVLGERLARVSVAARG